MASYPKKYNEAKNFAMKFSTTEIPVAVFNLEQDHRNYLIKLLNHIILYLKILAC